MATDPQLDTTTSDVSLWSGAREIYGGLSTKRRRQLYVVLMLMVLGAAAEVATIGALIPFLGLIANDGNLELLPWPFNRLGPLFDSTGYERLVSATVLFIAVTAIAASIRLRLAWVSQNFIFQLGHELSVEVQRRILSQPYSFHIHRNTSTLTSSLQKTEILVFSVLMPLIHSATAVFIAVFIVSGLIYVEPLTTVLAVATTGLFYLLVSLAARRRLTTNSTTMNRGHNERLRIVHESLGGIRDVIIDGSRRLHLENFRRIDKRLTNARAVTVFIAASPRFAIEAAGMIMIAVIALLLSSREGGIAAALPILGALALGAQRLLPLLQQIYHGWSLAAGHRSALEQVISFLRLPVQTNLDRSRESTPLPLTDKISFERVSFTYPTRRHAAVREITFEIPRGSFVGLIGQSGSGKSTLADLLMGLLEPTDGKIKIDGIALTPDNSRQWQQSIAHVSQSIFLTDASISRNIALSLPDDPIDSGRVIDAARRAQLHDFVTSLPEGYATTVGERGIRLSGGQRQRLGIARAIYKQTPLLVLDEATSALDNVTEAAVFDALVELRSQGHTIIAIANRTGTISRCDTVAHIDSGHLVKFGSSADALQRDRS